MYRRVFRQNYDDDDEEEACLGGKDVEETTTTATQSLFSWFSKLSPHTPSSTPVKDTPRAYTSVVQTDLLNLGGEDAALESKSMHTKPASDTSWADFDAVFSTPSVMHSPSAPVLTTADTTSKHTPDKTSVPAPSSSASSSGGADVNEPMNPHDDASTPKDLEDEDGATQTSKELLIYALPLCRNDESPIDGVVFLPIANFHEEETYDGLKGKVKEKMDRLAEKWDNLKDKEDGSLGKKVYKVGEDVMNNLTPEERLTRNIPKNVDKIIIYHPTTVTPDVIQDKLTHITQGHQTWTSAKAAVAGLVLPIAFGIDTVIIPGPALCTYYTGYQLFKNVRSAVGSQRLSRYITQQGDSKNVRVNYAGDKRLDVYWDATMHCDRVLEEEACEQLIHDIDQPELLQPLLELRKRKLAELDANNTTLDGQEYVQLRSRAD